MEGSDNQQYNPVPGQPVSFNLSIVNPGMSNQGYILNPVSSPMVGYSSPVTLQSYFTLPGQNGGDMVSMPMPVGMPVLQMNTVNTSIMLGNDECTSPILVKPMTAENNNGHTLSYLTKTGVQDGMDICNAVVKKPCPLEMSMRAAQIDEEDMIEAAAVAKCVETAVEPCVVPLPHSVPELVVPIIEELEVQPVLNGNLEPLSVHESLICEVEEANDSSDPDDPPEKDAERGSEENDKLPLSMVLKIRKVKDEPKHKKEETHRRKKSKRKRRPTVMEEYSMEWGESDEETLSSKMEALSTPKEIDLKKFVKVRNCCSKKECCKKITIKDQKIAHKNFYELESIEKQDTYLINCIEHVQKPNTSMVAESLQDIPEDIEEVKQVDDIKLEIENESKGNPTLSDEIQNAINESLKDCLEHQQKDVEMKVQERNDEEEDKEKGKETRNGSWNFYIVIERCRKRVCLQFLMKLFRLSKKRIKSLQHRVLTGSPLVEESSKTSGSWTEAAAAHFATVASEECAQCRLNPKHRALEVPLNTRTALFEAFKEFYMSTHESSLGVKYQAYCRFLSRECQLYSFLPQKPDTCSECENIEEQKRRRLVKLEQSEKKTKNAKRKQGRGKRKFGTGSDSDDEPLIKRRQLKMTISLKKVKEGAMKKEVKRKAEGKGARQGRDVWSLMLLHLESMPFKTCKGCLARKKHRYLSPAEMSTRSLYDDYRKYFLKETNSELGLGFAMYDKYFQKNCGYTIADLNPNEEKCLRCELEPPPTPKVTKQMKNSKPQAKKDRGGVKKS